MADSYFSGLGVAAGTAVTVANDTTTGNIDFGDPGHQLAFTTTATAGSVCNYARPAAPAGPGVTITGVATDQRMVNLDHNTARGGALQVLYTPSGTPTVENALVVARGNGDVGFGCFLFHTTGNTLQLRNSASANVSTTVALTANNTYQIDLVVDLSATPTTSNGRLIFRVLNLSTPTWNTTGEHYFDSGYTTNAGTTQPGRWRVWKTSTGSAFPQAYFTGLRWGERTAFNTSTDPTTTKAQFITASGPPTLSTAGSGVFYLIDAVGTAGGGGALSYSITQTAGVTTTPTLITAGKWKVVQGTAPLTYRVTVTETGSSSDFNDVVVPAASSASGQYFRQRLVGGVLV